MPPASAHGSTAAVHSANQPLTRPVRAAAACCAQPAAAWFLRGRSPAAVARARNATIGRAPRTAAAAACRWKWCNKFVTKDIEIKPAVVRAIEGTDKQPAGIRWQSQRHARCTAPVQSMSPDLPAHARQAQALQEWQPREDGHQHIWWQVQKVQLATWRGHAGRGRSACGPYALRQAAAGVAAVGGTA